MHIKIEKEKQQKQFNTKNLDHNKLTEIILAQTWGLKIIPSKVFNLNEMSIIKKCLKCKGVNGN